MKNNNKLTTTLLSTTLLSTTLLATSFGAASQEAHVHGSAQMDVVQEGATVFVSLISPLADIIGFEHAPETEAQKQTMRSVYSLLQTQAMVTMSGQGCALTDSDIDLPGADETHDDHDQEGHDEHDDDHDHEGHDEHDDDHDHEGHDEHDDDHDHEGHDDHETHGELSLTLTFQCDAPPTGLTVNLFTHFPSVETITLNWISDKGQGAKKLSANSNTAAW